MAFPFGGHPTFSQYLTWAAQAAGCRVQTGYRTAKGGRTHTMTIITIADKHVIMADVQQNERLEPNVVAHLDRRLGLVSPWSFHDGNGDAQK